MKNFETEAPSTYSEDNFYTAVTNQAERTSVRFSTSLAKIMQTIVEQKKFTKIKTVSDLIRDAVYHRLHYLSSTDGIVDDTLRRAEVMQAIAEHEIEQAAFVATISTIEKMAKLLYEAGESKRAKQQYRRLAEEVEGMSNGYWKSRYKRELEERFKVLEES